MRRKRILTEEHKKKISNAHKGKKKVFSIEAIENIRAAAAKRKGIKTGPRTIEVKEKIRKATLGKKKKITIANPSWFPKGYIGSNRFKKGQKSWNEGKFLTDSRMGNKYKEWRKKILEKDGNKCIKCGSIEKLHCHHLIPWKVDQQKRFDVENGIVLCNSCHSKEDKEQKRNCINPGWFKKGNLTVT